MADRPKASPARIRPDVAQPNSAPLVLTAAPSHGELKLIAQTLCLPLLTTSNSADLVAQIKASSMAKEGGDAGVCTALVHAAFKLIDKNGDGVLSRIEVVKALRTSAQVRKLLALPEKIRQEDGTRDLFERVYQGIDTDDSKSITLPEFEAYFSPATQPAPPPPAASMLSDGTVFVSITIAALGVAYALLLIRYLALAKLSVGGSPSPSAAAAAVNGDAAVAATAVASLAKTAAARVAAAVANSAVGAAIAARVATANPAVGAATAAPVATAAAADATAAVAAADATADATADPDAPAESSGAAVYRAAGYPQADPAATPSPMSM